MKHNFGSKLAMAEVIRSLEQARVACEESQKLLEEHNLIDTNAYVLVVRAQKQVKDAITRMTLG